MKYIILLLLSAPCLSQSIIAYNMGGPAMGEFRESPVTLDGDMVYSLDPLESYITIRSEFTWKHNFHGPGNYRVDFGVRREGIGEDPSSCSWVILIGGTQSDATLRWMSKPNNSTDTLLHQFGSLNGWIHMKFLPGPECPIHLAFIRVEKLGGLSQAQIESMTQSPGFFERMLNTIGL